ncbi:sulfotransferase [Fulvivirga sp. M361]|uniref:sulfotransferase family protein n=1 Tax=Fulvivirga sp. M361 TaxID=2594266 RepID=UPI001179DBF2|nr:sulfotransferase [Fulvivirga sp. M361]TRX45896.1 sulfotransferase [Fulvivirga sp. M361]
MKNHRHVFICGLHRSGTTILHNIISSSEQVSGFANTGAIMDEGQHLQSVYENARCYGGPGAFCFDSRARLDERSELITDVNKQKLLKDWGQHWDLNKPVLLEKSPPNLIRTRFLQKLFPGAYFIVIVRHPIPVSLATMKMTIKSANHQFPSLLEHWLVAHKIYLEDQPYLKNQFLVSYEDMIKRPTHILGALERFLNIKIPHTDQLTDKNKKYWAHWVKESRFGENFDEYQVHLINHYEEHFNHFGYSLLDPEKFPVQWKKGI